MSETRTETATLGGGCFWCLEAVYRQVDGVAAVVSGYAGGHVANPGYREVCGGRTGHAEVVQLTFDPAIIGYRGVLEAFFAMHDPTSRDRQGNDVGPQYRSVILYHDARQRETAKGLIRELEAERAFDAPIVTELAPLEAFYPAEDSHQLYYQRNPDQPYCQIVIAPKLAKFRQRFRGE